MRKESVKTAPNTSRKKMGGLAKLLGSPLLLEGENQKDYEELDEAVRAEIGPVDIIEEFWVRDIIELFWQGLRLRTLKVSLLNSSRIDGLNKLLEPLSSDEYSLMSPSDWLAGKKDTLGIIGKFMDQNNFGESAIMAQTLSVKLADVERIDAMIMRAEARRIAILREIDRRRESRPPRAQIELKSLSGDESFGD
jgi:hypothetical protein